MSTTMTTALHRLSDRHERGCDPVACDFTVAKVRVYLICWEQAARYGEPFDHVFCAVKSSRAVDPWNRGGRADTLRAIDIRIALEQAAAAGQTLASWNAENVARWLCLGAHHEPAVDEDAFEALR